MFNLIKIVYSSIRNTKNIYRSIFGYNIINNVKINKNSELNKDNWSLISIIYLLTDLLIPSLPIHCPDWMPNFIKRVFFRGNSKYIEDNNRLEDNKNNGECILYVNGILTNEILLNQNKKLLNQLFKKPINCIHNNTDSVIMDLIECTIGKCTNDLTESSYLTLRILSCKLLDKNINKIIIISHSQGTIIIGQVIRNLCNFGLDKVEYLKKIEIYCFANCCSKMEYVRDNLPYMEHFANEHDVIAKMGCNHDKDISELIKIDGITFIKENKYGHMFNSHYIDNFTTDYPDSRLNNYID